MIILCDDKHTVKIGVPRNYLALVLKNKTGRMAANSESREAYHDTFFKSNVVYTACFLIDITDEFILGKFCKGRFMIVLRKMLHTGHFLLDMQ